jgi:hypothetical protein
MIDQIRHLQSRDPFETFSIELANGRVIQIQDRHLVATTDGISAKNADYIVQALQRLPKARRGDPAAT